MKVYQIGSRGIGELIPIYNKREQSITFIEITGAKNVSTTTILKNGKAVHSRNIAMLGKLVASQYYGYCLIE